MVPTLKIHRDVLADNGFINGYCSDATGDVQYENVVYLLFKPTNLDKFRKFVDDERDRTSSLIDDYDYEGKYVVLVYQLDTKYNQDFNLIKQGRYSKTSSEFQSLFPKTVKVFKNGVYKDEISLQYRIFNKTDDLKNYWEDRLGVDFDESMELWNGWNEETESLDIEKIKQNV